MKKTINNPLNFFHFIQYTPKCFTRKHLIKKVLKQDPATFISSYALSWYIGYTPFPKRICCVRCKKYFSKNQLIFMINQHKLKEKLWFYYLKCASCNREYLINTKDLRRRGYSYFIEYYINVIQANNTIGGN